LIDRDDDTPAEPGDFLILVCHKKGLTDLLLHAETAKRTVPALALEALEALEALALAWHRQKACI